MMFDCESQVLDKFLRVPEGVFCFGALLLFTVCFIMLKMKNNVKNSLFASIPVTGKNRQRFAKIALLLEGSKKFLFRFPR